MKKMATGTLITIEHVAKYFVVYLVFCLAFAILLMILCRDGPTHFRGITEEQDSHPLEAFFTRFYFMVSTSTLCGVGDVSPKSHLARIIVIVILFLVVANIMVFLVHRR